MKSGVSCRSVLSGLLFTVVAGLCLAMTMGQGCANNGGDGGGGGGTTTGQFLGASDCQLCHSQHYTDWQGTRHAGALNTLKAIGQDKNTACIGCHTVGYGQAGGFVSEAATPELAGVQCENCHGAGLNHRSNVDDPNARPTRSIASAVCGNCHNGVHHPTMDEWSGSGHALVQEEVATEFEDGTSLNSCGTCHSGDFRDAKFVQEINPIPDTLLQGVPREEQNAVVCVTCHDPHKKTGNAAESAEGEDFQLRFAEVASPAQSNTLADNTNPARYNLCGQCHHARTRTWVDTSRPVHHSVQANMYNGEMPLPDNDQTPLVANTKTAHRFVPKQCVTCHMVPAEFQDTLNPANSGHGFAPNLEGCSAVGCHPSAEVAQSDMENLQTTVDVALANILDRLGAASTWEYSTSGGPSDQTTVPDEVKKVRFLYYWVLYDGSKGVHNPEYTRAILTNMDTRLTAVGK
jgi:hypothetical protein